MGCKLRASFICDHPKLQSAPEIRYFCNMLLQQIILVLIVLGAVGYLSRLLYKAFFSSEKHCAGACNCSPAKDAAR